MLPGRLLSNEGVVVPELEADGETKLEESADEDVVRSPNFLNKSLEVADSFLTTGRFPNPYVSGIVKHR